VFDPVKDVAMSESGRDPNVEPSDDEAANP
jgi:hypothetical protein